MDKIKTLIMDYDDYAKLESISPLKKFTITNGTQYLYYYGASHINEVGHPMFSDIEQYWNEFLSKVEDNEKALAINEGGLRKPEMDIRIAIKNEGEAGFLTYLAIKSNIDILSLEPDKKNVDMELIRKFSKEEIRYYYFAEVVQQYIRSRPVEGFEVYIARFLELDKQESGWTDFDFSLNNMKKIHTQIFGNQFNLEEHNFFFTITNPSIKNSVINQVARVSSDYRDAYIVKKIVEKWTEGRNIFVVYGFSHAYRQEKALISLLKGFGEQNSN